MITITLPTFEDPALCANLSSLSPDALDRLDFGVIGFDRETVVHAYNAFEAKAAGLRRDSVVRQRLFDVVAPCMNNNLVAERFALAATSGTTLDIVVPYTLTLRMRPTKVLLRLLADPQIALRYVLVQRRV